MALLEHGTVLVWRGIAIGEFFFGVVKQETL